MKKGRFELFWMTIGLRRAETRSFSSAVLRMSDYLAQPPFEISLDVQELPTESASMALSQLTQTDDITNASADIGAALIAGDPPRIRRLVIACPERHELWYSVVRKNRLASWGAHLGGPVAIAFRPRNRFLIWHECFHLFGAEDCYGPVGTRRRCTCTLENCIMVHKPAYPRVRAWPFLCKNNIIRVEKCLRGHFEISGS